MEIQVRLIRDTDNPLPAYQTPLSAGMDLCANLERPLVLEPGARALIPTGLRLEIPPGYEGQVRPRSGLALKRGLTVLNAPGTIDADYRGEIKVILLNQGRELISIPRGARIAQLVVQPVARAEIEEVDELPDTTRAAGGFGHTGLS